MKSEMVEVESLEISNLYIKNKEIMMVSHVRIISMKCVMSMQKYKWLILGAVDWIIFW